MSDEWCAILEHTQYSLGEFAASKSTVHCKEYCVAFLTKKMCFLCLLVLYL